MAWTTKQVLDNKKSYKVYEQLLFKRRYLKNTTTNYYSPSYWDVTYYLLESSAGKVSKKLDVENFAYGQVQTDSMSFELSNIDGTFNPENDLYSFFNGTMSRHYTKVQYKAGYRDPDNNYAIQEIIYNGLINEKSTTVNFEAGTIKFTTLGLDTILNETVVPELYLKNYIPVPLIVLIDRIFKINTLKDWNFYNASKITFGGNYLLADTTKYENKKVSEIITDICKKSNSVWYIDDADQLVITPRIATATPVVTYYGGADPQGTPVMVSLDELNEGYGRLINSVQWECGDNTYSEQLPPSNLMTFGTNSLDLSGEEVSDENVIRSIIQIILQEWGSPRRQIKMTIRLSPNVHKFFDRIKVKYTPRTIIPDKPLIWNDDTYWNDGYYYASLENRMILDDGIVYIVVGWEHDYSNCTTQLYLLQSI